MANLRRRALLALAATLASIASLRLGAQQRISVADFMRLSRRLTGRKTLDSALASTYLGALLAVPGNGGILSDLARGARAATPEQIALEGTIIEWWYTGTYAVGKERRLATHDGALMWESLGTPAPGTCAGAFGAWSRPPPRRA